MLTTNIRLALEAKFRRFGKLRWVPTRLSGYLLSLASIKEIFKVEIVPLSHLLEVEVKNEWS